ncbi:hypothetical protein GQ53DRAFT_525401 [Thozetella sp. PMI_491]|nr:hypothetical protein GQ53DRAFT_525401 [Thozetella sp. PMI_491]
MEGWRQNGEAEQVIADEACLRSRLLAPMAAVVTAGHDSRLLPASSRARQAGSRPAPGASFTPAGCRLGALLKSTAIPAPRARKREGWRVRGMTSQPEPELCSRRTGATVPTTSSSPHQSS